MKIVVVGATALLLSLSGPPVWAEQRIDVSQVIDSTEAAKILAQPGKDPTPFSGDGDDGYYSKCNYYSVIRGRLLVIRLQIPGPNAIGTLKELQLIAATNESMKSVPDIGDTVQMCSSGGESGFISRALMLYVVKGNVFLTIGLGEFIDDVTALEKAKAVAQKNPGTSLRNDRRS
jgi:hypothetical protein